MPIFPTWCFFFFLITPRIKVLISGPKQQTSNTVLQIKVSFGSPIFAPCFYVAGIQYVDFRLAATCDLLAAGLMNLVLTRINVSHAVAVSNLVS